MTLKYSTGQDGQQFIANYKGPEGEIFLIGVDSRFKVYSPNVDQERKLIDAAMNVLSDLRIMERLEKEFDGRYALFELSDLCKTIDDLREENKKSEEIIRKGIEHGYWANNQQLISEKEVLKKDLQQSKKYVDDLGKKNKNLKYENDCLKTAIDFNKQTFKEYENQENRFINEIKLLNLKLSLKTSFTESLYKDNEFLRNNYNLNVSFPVIKTKFVMDEETTRVIDNMNYIIKVNEEKENLKSDLQQSRKDVDDLKRKLDESITRNSAMSDYLNKFVTGYLKAMDKVQVLEDVLADETCVTLVELYNNQRENIKGYQMTIREMEKELAEAKNHGGKINDELKTKLSLIIDHVEDLLTGTMDLKVENMDLKKKLAQSELKRGQYVRDMEMDKDRFQEEYSKLNAAYSAELNKSWWQKLLGK